EKRETTPARPTHLVGQIAPRSYALTLRGILRAAIQRPLLWFPSPSRVPYRPQHDQTHVEWDTLVHRGRYHALLRCNRPPTPPHYPQGTPPREQVSAPDPAPPPGRIPRAVDLSHHPQWDTAGQWRYTSYKVANLPIEFSTSIPRTQLRPGY